MKGSIIIGRIAGIKIMIHWTFFLLILWIAFTESIQGNTAEETLWTIGFILSLFVTIVLHELGHALTAKSFHFKTCDITLLPIGGVARMDDLPKKPFQEFLVAIMGPMVNIAISFTLFLFMGSTYEINQVTSNIHIEKSNFWFNFYTANIFLALFNLIPAFPMDGGRILRALLSTFMVRVKATRVAARIGQIIAIAFIILGFIYSPTLVLIGVFIFIGAQAETTIETTRDIFKDIHVGDIVMRNFSELHFKEPLSKAVSMILDSQERAFLIKDDVELKGTLSKKEVIRGLCKFGSNASIEQVMITPVISLQEQERLSDVIQKYSNLSDTLMPVYSGKKLVGVLDFENIQEFMQIRAAIKLFGQSKID